MPFMFISVKICVGVDMVHLQSRLYYMCAFQMNSVCVVCVVTCDRGLFNRL